MFTLQQPSMKTEMRTRIKYTSNMFGPLKMFVVNMYTLAAYA